MIKLIWAVVVLTSTGPMPGKMQDETKFQSVEACRNFAGEHQARMEDVVRGMLNAAWVTPVEIAWKCEAEGDPA